MGSFGDHWEDEILDHIFNKGAYSAPTIYIALSTVDPTDDASGLAEPSDGYARVETEAADWNAASSGTVTNANDIEFPEASGDWGTISHFALYDAASGGNMLAHGSLTASKDITTGDTAKFSAGDLSVSLD